MTSSSPPPINIIKLSPSTPPDTLKRAGKTVDAAFHGSTLNDILTGGIRELGIARSVALVTTCALDLEGYLAEVGGEIVGVLCAKPKGFEHRKSPSVNGPHSERVDAIVAEHPETKGGVEELVQQVGALKKRAYGEGDITDMWYISHLAISPQWQGKGVGAALMRHFMDKIGGEQCTLLAVEEGLVPWYGRFGFKNLADDDVVITGQPLVHFWAMST